MTDYRNFAVFACSSETALVAYEFSIEIGLYVVENCFWDYGTKAQL